MTRCAGSQKLRDLLKALCFACPPDPKLLVDRIDMYVPALDGFLLENEGQMGDINPSSGTADVVDDRNSP